MLSPTRICTAAFAAALLSMPVAVAAQAALPADSLERARMAAKFFYAGEIDSLVARMKPATLERLGGRAGLAEGLSTVGTRAGDEVSVSEERWNVRNGQRQYWRTSRMSLFPDDFLLRIILDEEGNIAASAWARRRWRHPRTVWAR